MQHDESLLPSAQPFDILAWPPELLDHWLAHHGVSARDRAAFAEERRPGGPESLDHLARLSCGSLAVQHAVAVHRVTSLETLRYLTTLTTVPTNRWLADAILSRDDIDASPSISSILYEQHPTDYLIGHRAHEAAPDHVPAPTTPPRHRTFGLGRIPLGANNRWLYQPEPDDIVHASPGVLDRWLTQCGVSVGDREAFAETHWGGAPERLDGFARLPCDSLAVQHAVAAHPDTSVDTLIYLTTLTSLGDLPRPHDGQRVAAAILARADIRDTPVVASILYHQRPTDEHIHARAHAAAPHLVPLVEAAGAPGPARLDERAASSDTDPWLWSRMGRRARARSGVPGPGRVPGAEPGAELSGGGLSPGL